MGNRHDQLIFEYLIFLNSLAPSRPKLIPTLHGNHTNFHQKRMTAKQVLRQVNFVLIFADFLGRLQVPESLQICENATGDMIL